MNHRSIRKCVCASVCLFVNLFNSSDRPYIQWLFVSLAKNKGAFDGSKAGQKSGDLRDMLRLTYIYGLAPANLVYFLAGFGFPLDQSLIKPNHLRDTEISSSQAFQTAFMYFTYLSKQRSCISHLFQNNIRLAPLSYLFSKNSIICYTSLFQQHYHIFRILSLMLLSISKPHARAF